MDDSDIPPQFGVVQAKLCDLQPHFCIEHFPLQWQITISLIAVGAGNSFVACGFTVFSVDPFCNGSMNSWWWATLARPQTLACTWTLCACCFRHPLSEEVYHFLSCVYKTSTNVILECSRSEYLQDCKHHTRMKLILSDDAHLHSSLPIRAAVGHQ